MKIILMLAAAFTALYAVCDEVWELAKALNVGSEAKMVLRIVDANGVPTGEK